MPFFRSTKDILKTPWEDEVFNPNWMDTNKPYLPPRIEWDYQREMKIEDVDIWEQIHLESNGLGLYAAWTPYAEFYLITHRYFADDMSYRLETFYGPGAMKKAYDRAQSLGMYISVSKMWVDENDLWLYQEPPEEKSKTIILPNSI